MKSLTLIATILFCLKGWSSEILTYPLDSVSYWGPNWAKLYHTEVSSERACFLNLAYLKQFLVINSNDEQLQFVGYCERVEYNQTLLNAAIKTNLPSGLHVISQVCLPDGTNTPHIFKHLSNQKIQLQAILLAIAGDRCDDKTMSLYEFRILIR